MVERKEMGESDHLKSPESVYSPFMGKGHKGVWGPWKRSPLTWCEYIAMLFTTVH